MKYHITITAEEGSNQWSEGSKSVLIYSQHLDATADIREVVIGINEAAISSSNALIKERGPMSMPSFNFPIFTKNTQ